jgi:post-segregation antitoxin (ccd killing protein)
MAMAEWVTIEVDRCATWRVSTDYIERYGPESFGMNISALVEEAIKKRAEEKSADKEQGNG